MKVFYKMLTMFLFVLITNLDFCQQFTYWMVSINNLNCNAIGKYHKIFLILNCNAAYKRDFRRFYPKLRIKGLV